MHTGKSKVSMASASRRKSSAKLKSTNDSETSAGFQIRYDYSDTHLDNEELELRYKNQANELSHEKYRTMLEADEVLRKAKQNADDMLQLKDKVKSRQQKNSSQILSQSLDLKRNNGLEETHKTESGKHTGQQSHPEKCIDLAVDKITAADTECADIKPLNNLTMFLLSIQRLKRPQLQSSHHDKKIERLDKIHQNDSEMKHTLLKRPAKSALLSRRPQSYRSGGNIDQAACDDEGHMSKPQYGIHVRKDFSRSRRELEEISRLEQGNKNTACNKYEERRKRLLDKCKDTHSLQSRINHFLKDVDEFKLLSKEESTLESALTRTKTTLFSKFSTYVS